jgi:prepilin peptidase CpaA
VSSAQVVSALALVTVAALFDVATKRIPNALTYASWAWGLALGASLGGWAGLTDSALGFAAGFLPVLVMFVGGSIGGGDVKLMGGVGAFLGFPGGLNAFIASILVGGFFAAVILLWQGRLWPVLRHPLSVVWSKIYPIHVPYPAPVATKDAFPFGVAIALGTYLTLASMLLGERTPANLFVN